MNLTDEQHGLCPPALGIIPLFYDHIMLGGPRRDEQVEDMIATARNITRAGAAQTVEMLAEYPIMLAVQSSVAQLVERTAVNRMVAGSSPARGAKSGDV